MVGRSFLPIATTVYLVPRLGNPKNTARKEKYVHNILRIIKYVVCGGLSLALVACCTTKIPSSFNEAAIMTVNGNSALQPQQLNEFKANLSAMLTKHRVDPQSAMLQPSPDPSTLNYYFFPEYPNVFQAFGEAASLAVRRSNEEGVTLKVLPHDSDPTCAGPPGDCSFRYNCGSVPKCVLLSAPANACTPKCPHN